MEHDVVGKVRVELHQVVFAAKECKLCGETNPWNAETCSCGAALPADATVKEDRGLVAFSESEVS